jgi:hypothetical protein
MPFHELARPAVFDPRETCDRLGHGAGQLALLPHDEVGLPLQQSLPIVEQRGRVDLRQHLDERPLDHLRPRQRPYFRVGGPHALRRGDAGKASSFTDLRNDSLAMARAPALAPNRTK